MHCGKLEISIFRQFVASIGKLFIIFFWEGGEGERGGGGGRGTGL